MAERAGYTELVVQAERVLSAIPDPELRRLAFQKVLDDLHASPVTRLLDSSGKLIQVLAVVVGVIISVLSFNATRYKEAEAKQMELAKFETQRKDELAKRQAEATKPFLVLQQELYTEAIKTAGILANPSHYTAEEQADARQRFRELYVAELSMVEGRGVEQRMKDLAAEVDPELRTLTPKQRAAYNLAHALRASLASSWMLNDGVVPLDEE